MVAPPRICITFAAVTLCACAWAQTKPVAIVASGNASGGDRKFFNYYVVTPLGVVAENRGEFLDPREFGKYSLVVWLRSARRKFTPEQVKAIGKYVASGGHLLMTNAVPYVGLKLPFRGAPWTGAHSWGYNRTSWPAAVLKPEDPYLKGVPPKGGKWLRGAHAMTRFKGVNVIGKAGAWTTSAMSTSAKEGSSSQPTGPTTAAAKRPRPT